MMLNVLSHYDVGALSELDRLHLFAEVCKQGYHHRDVLFGDAALAKVPVEHLLSDAWKAAAHGAIDMGRARPPRSTLRSPGRSRRAAPTRTRSISAWSTGTATRCR